MLLSLVTGVGRFSVPIRPICRPEIIDIHSARKRRAKTQSESGNGKRVRRSKNMEESGSEDYQSGGHVGSNVTTIPNMASVQSHRAADLSISVWDPALTEQATVTTEVRKTTANMSYPDHADTGPPHPDVPGLGATRNDFAGSTHHNAGYSDGKRLRRSENGEGSVSQDHQCGRLVGNNVNDNDVAADTPTTQRSATIH